MTSSAPRGVCYGLGQDILRYICGSGGQRSGLTAEPAVIDYETFAKIHDCRDRRGPDAIAQTARALGLNPEDGSPHGSHVRASEPRRSRPRGSVLDPSSRTSRGCWTLTPIALSKSSSVCTEDGYRGGVTILRDYVRRIRPTKRPVYLEAGLLLPANVRRSTGVPTGTVAAGNTRRRLSFFVMVLAFSRQIVHGVHRLGRPWSISSLSCHERAFAAFWWRAGQNHGRQSQIGGPAAPRRRRTVVQSALSGLCPPPWLW